MHAQHTRSFKLSDRGYHNDRAHCALQQFSSVSAPCLVFLVTILIKSSLNSNGSRTGQVHDPSTAAGSSGSELRCHR